jgi:hypothetical protein
VHALYSDYTRPEFARSSAVLLLRAARSPQYQQPMRRIRRLKSSEGSLRQLGDELTHWNIRQKCVVTLRQERKGLADRLRKW